ncbi:hypothetical protein Patl1_07705 [Pistacia atlantica]|uniref:Uncharacterized protein n=1 Tax=Pistacia atlantica TaxID=434234 RepID=A0ACC1AEQ6_9ROSI|nr:hypothetical protein Patl1_07705 [Pistacia atlantica]
MMVFLSLVVWLSNSSMMVFLGDWYGLVWFGKFDMVDLQLDLMVGVLECGFEF